MRSIRTILSLSLAAVIVFVGFSAAAIYYFQTLEEEKSNIDQFIHTESTILPGEIALPLWKYDLDGVRLLCSERLKNSRIKSIKITDDEQNVVFQTGTGSVGTSLFLVKPIVYNGENIGTMAIAFDNSELVTLRKDIFNVTFYMLLFVVCAAIVSVLLLTKWLVTKPFNQITQILTELKNENYSWQFRGSLLKEMQPIENGLKGLSQELFERNKEIKEHTHDLETYNKTLLEEIDRRKKAESALMESKSFLSTLLERIPMPVFYKDSDGYYLGFNRAYEVFFGKSRNELIGKTAFEINPEAFAKAYHTKDLELFEKGGMQEYESQILNGKGNVRDVIFNKEVYRDRQGNIIGLIGTVLDITERKKSESEREKLQAKLMQSQKMESIGNLAGGIAHDFNNILSAVIGFTELALDEVEKGSTIENSLQEVHMAGKRAKDLVKQILTFARQSGEERHPIQPGLIAKEVLQFMRSTIPTTIEINHRIESGSFVMGNATQFHQVMMNLCTNAAHAMEDGGGTIEVSISDVPAHMVAGTDLSELPDQGYVEIRVSDTGVGIAPDTIDSIFEPYFTTKDPGEGTGMGLAVVQGIVESYGGQIRVKSELGEGSTFVIYMPTTRKSGQRSANEKQDLPTGDEQILFVDDEAPLARLGERMLSRLGYAVTTRTRSTEAMELFRSKPDDFDLVITDMAMPGMAGDQLAVALMNIRPDVPVILCTGYSKKMSKERALEIGIRAFANKPIVLADLAKAVRTVLDEAKLKTRG